MTANREGMKIDKNNTTSKGRFPLKLWLSADEDFRMLRTRVVDAFNEAQQKIILVTSAFPKEGKTEVALNLARALADSSRRTLLMDSDLRLPEMHHLFGLNGSPGLSDIIREERIIDEAFHPTDLDCLEVLTSGKAPVDVVELLGCPYTTAMMVELRNRFDYVVVDSPPMIPLADTMVLARHADGIILVVKSEVTPKEAVLTAIEQIGKRPIIGLVMNGVSVSSRYWGY
jgi:capsular exopolysaccharide synthesis family protein